MKFRIFKISDLRFRVDARLAPEIFFRFVINNLKSEI